MYTNSKELKFLKNKLKSLRAQYYHSIVTEADEYRKILKHAQIQLLSNPTSADYKQTEG